VAFSMSAVPSTRSANVRHRHEQAVRSAW
jgi:hypothetical protein